MAKPTYLTENDSILKQILSGELTRGLPNVYRGSMGYVHRNDMFGNIMLLPRSYSSQETQRRDLNAGVYTSNSDIMTVPYWAKLVPPSFGYLGTAKDWEALQESLIVNPDMSPFYQTPDLISQRYYTQKSPVITSSPGVQPVTMELEHPDIYTSEAMNSLKDLGEKIKKENKKTIDPKVTQGLITTGGNILGSALSGDYTTKAGKTLQTAGTLAGSVLPGWWGAATSAVLNTAGGLTNRLWGSVVDEEKVNELKNQLEVANNRTFNASSTNDLIGQSNFGLVNSVNNDLGEDGLWSNKIKDMEADYNANIGLVNRQTLSNFNRAASDLDTMNDRNMLANYKATGGPLNMRYSGVMSPFGNQFSEGGHVFNTHGGNFSNGLTYINSGGTHEQNPYEGVPMGVDPEGTPNLVEEGETIFNDYVFSNRLNVPKAIRSKYKLRGNKNMTFAEVSKKLAKESEERPNDPISQNGLEALMADLMLAQEQIRLSENKKDNNTVNKFDEGGPKFGGNKGDSLSGNPYLDNGTHSIWYQNLFDNVTLDHFKEFIKLGREIIDNEALLDTPVYKYYKKFFDNSHYKYLKQENAEIKDDTWERIKDNSSDLKPGDHYTWMEAMASLPLVDSDLDKYTKIHTDEEGIAKAIRDGMSEAEAKKLYDTYGPLVNKSLYQWLSENSAAISAYNAKNNSTFELPADPLSFVLNPELYKLGKTIFLNDPIIKETGLGKNALNAAVVTTKKKEIPPEKKTEDIVEEDTEVRPDLLDRLKHYNTWPRYAPILGFGMTALTDALGWTNKPDYTKGEAIVSAGNKVSTPRTAWNPIGNYLSYRPLDVNYQLNKLNAASAAAKNSILNAAAGNRNQALSSLLAEQYNSNTKLGDLYKAAEEYNAKQRQEVEAFNRTTNQTNAEGILKAAMANQDAAYKEASARLDAITKGYQMMGEIDKEIRDAKSSNMSGFFNAMGALGADNVSLNSRNFLLGSGAVGNVDSQLLDLIDPKMFKAKAKGGKLKRVRKGLTY